MSELELLLAKHRKEVKDLTATITGMKKQASKKTRKQVNKKCQEMEAELKERHAREVRALNGDEEADQDDDDVSPEKLLAQLELEKGNSEETPGTKPEDMPEAPKKKRNRQKERLARRQAEEDKMRAEAEKEAEGQVDYGKLEKESLDELCKKMKLIQHDILPDGNCLFASIADQLKVRHGIEVLVQELREKAADHIKANEAQFQPFLFDENTLTMGDIDEYVQKMKSTSEWGGDMEILALAKVYDAPISVLIAGSALHRVNEEGAHQELKLVYYKHAYGLGEHYNSLRDED